MSTTTKMRLDKLEQLHAQRQTRPNTTYHLPRTNPDIDDWSRRALADISARTTADISALLNKEL